MSQFAEDLHIEAVFAEIGFGSRVLLDVGARLLFSNSQNLIEKHGFAATLVEVNPVHCAELRRTFPTARVVEKMLKPEEINDVCPVDCWFLSIDIDSADWWMWANLRQRPALVVVETNGLPGLFVAHMGVGKKDANGYGMSQEAADLLASAKGYDYIGRTEVNAFYVRKDLKCQYRLPAQSIHKGVPCGRANNVFA